MVLTTLIAALAVFSSSQPGDSNGFALTSAAAVTYSEASLAKEEKGASTGKASSDKKSLTYAGASVRLVVRTGPEDDMLSYRVQGLRNPTIYVPAGAEVTVVFVNTDEDMLHNFRVTSKAPRYDSKMTGVVSVGSKDLKHRTTRSIHGAVLKMRAPKVKGTYYYVCTISGHAAAGMYGVIEVQ